MTGLSKTPRKGIALVAMLLLIVLLCCACGQKDDPAPEVLPEETLTGDGGVTPPILPHGAEESVETRPVSLYYRMQGEEMLACETRTVLLPTNRLVEEVLIEALIDGPSANLLELTGLFNSGTKARVWSSGDLLTVQLSNDFLAEPPGAPANWGVDPAWRSEVLIRRQLGLASIVNTITEETDYTSVQFLVLDYGETESGRRLLRSELYDGAPIDQLLAPVVRSEHFLLTHYNTANLILRCWQEQDYMRMYRYIAQSSGTRPTDTELFEAVSALDRPLLSYAVSAGQVTEDGTRAVVDATYELLSGGETTVIQNFPMRLVRERGIWKIAYEDLMRMMEAL